MRRHRIGEALRDSLQGNGLRLVFQPKFTLSAQPRLAGAEALLRWRHPELGEVSPAEFIPIAETTEVIVAVDRFVSSRLFAQIKAWRALGLDLPVMALNLSARSLRQPCLKPAIVPTARPSTAHSGTFDRNDKASFRLNVGFYRT